MGGTRLALRGTRKAAWDARVVGSTSLLEADGVVAPSSIRIGILVVRCRTRASRSPQSLERRRHLGDKILRRWRSVFLGRHPRLVATTLALGFPGRDLATGAGISWASASWAGVFHAPHHEEQFADHFASHPLVETKDQFSLEKPEFLQPGGRAHRHHQSRSIQAHRLGVAGDSLADYLVPRLPDAEIVEAAIQTDSRKGSLEKVGEQGGAGTSHGLLVSEKLSFRAARGGAQSWCCRRGSGSVQEPRFRPGLSADAQVADGERKFAAETGVPQYLVVQGSTTHYLEWIHPRLDHGARRPLALHTGVGLIKKLSRSACCGLLDHKEQGNDDG